MARERLFITRTTHTRLRYIRDLTWAKASSCLGLRSPTLPLILAPASLSSASCCAREGVPLSQGSPVLLYSRPWFRLRHSAAGLSASLKAQARFLFSGFSSCGHGEGAGEAVPPLCLTVTSVCTHTGGNRARDAGSLAALCRWLYSTGYTR